MQHSTDIAFAGETLMGSKPSAASLAVLSALEGAGLEAWIVGGWVRDALMGASGHDIDICCSGSWEESAAALRSRGIAVVESGVKFGGITAVVDGALRSRGIAVVESGVKFGGITAVVDGERIEVTAYRLDGFYTDGRHPENVQRATCVEDDLARRDFTVNAMAWHPARGLLDCYDGRGDLERRQSKSRHIGSTAFTPMVVIRRTFSVQRASKTTLLVVTSR